MGEPNGCCEVVVSIRTRRSGGRSYATSPMSPTGRRGRAGARRLGGWGGKHPRPSDTNGHLDTAHGWMPTTDALYLWKERALIRG